jgi:hypothetical protein
MSSRRKPKPSVKAKERAEPHFGGRKRDGPRKPRKPQARKNADRPLRRAASSTRGLLAGMERQVRDRDRPLEAPPQRRTAYRGGMVMRRERAHAPNKTGLQLRPSRSNSPHLQFTYPWGPGWDHYAWQSMRTAR